MQRIADISVFELAGEIDLVEGRDLLERIGRLLTYQCCKIVLDFAQVDHVHYRFWAGLVLAAAGSGDARVKIKLAGLTPYHWQILKAVGADWFLETYDSVPDAVLSFHDEFSSSTGPC